MNAPPDMSDAIDKKDLFEFHEGEVALSQLPQDGLETNPNKTPVVNTLRDMAQDSILKSRNDNMTRWETAKKFRRVWMYCFIIYTVNMIDGWQVGIAGAIIVNKGFIEQFGTQDGNGVYKLSENWVGAWGAIINVGQLISSFFVAYIANKWGRKAAFLGCFISYEICLLTLTVAKTPAVWLVGKLFVGIAAGLGGYVSGAYMMEISPNQIRGSTASFQGFWGGICGILNSLMLQLANKRYPTFYKLPIYVCWGLSSLMLAAIIICPESPWYYGRHGKKDQCIKSMKRLYGNIPGINYEEEYEIIRRTLELERERLAENKATPFKDLFVGQNKYRMLVMVYYTLAMHWGGMPLISTFGTYFFAIAGFNDPFLVNVIMSCIGLVTTIIYTIVIDKVGRRPIVLIFFGFQCAALWLIGGLYYVHTKGSQLALLVLIAVWQISFSFMSGPSGVMSAEVPSAHLRVKNNAFVAASTIGSAITVTFTVPRVLARFNLRGCFIYGATALPFFICLALFLPETRNRAAAEIDELYERKIPAWRWRNTKTYVEEQMQAVVEVDRIDAAKVQDE